MSRSNRNGQWLGSVVLAVGFLVALLAAVFFMAPSVGKARCLSEFEMARVIGDSPGDPCPCSSNCNQGLKATIVINGNNVTVCGYCDYSATQKICCNTGGSGSTCNPSGGTAACGTGNTWKYGGYSGLGTCDSCSPTGTITSSGNCNSMKNATGTVVLSCACPPQ